MNKNVEKFIIWIYFAVLNYMYYKNTACMLDYERPSVTCVVRSFSSLEGTGIRECDSYFVL
jgi:hypothetical protein